MKGLLDLSPQNTALLVIDMQKDFYGQDAGTVKRGKKVDWMRQTAKRVDRFVDQMIKRGVLVVFTKYISGENVTPPNLQKVADKGGYSLACAKGSGMEEIDGVEAPKEVKVLEKPHYDAFAYTSSVV